MTRRESVNGVRLVCPWWARGVDSGCKEEGGSGLGTFEKSKDKKKQGIAMKDGTQWKEAQPFMSVEPRQKSVVLKPRHCKE